MTLKEFRTMLLGAVITVHTDHKNLTFDNLKTQRVLCWQTYVKEYTRSVHCPAIIPARFPKIFIF